MWRSRGCYHLFDFANTPPIVERLAFRATYIRANATRFVDGLVPCFASTLSFFQTFRVGQ